MASTIKSGNLYLRFCFRRVGFFLLFHKIHYFLALILASIVSLKGMFYWVDIYIRLCSRFYSGRINIFAFQFEIWTCFFYHCLFCIFLRGRRWIGGYGREFRSPSIPLSTREKHIVRYCRHKLKANVIAIVNVRENRRDSKEWTQNTEKTNNTNAPENGVNPGDRGD